jgi:hypothetical protein
MAEFKPRYHPKQKNPSNQSKQTKNKTTERSDHFGNLKGNSGECDNHREL